MFCFNRLSYVVFATDRSEIAEVIEEEEKRQKGRLGLIASENFVSRAVREAQGSVLTNNTLKATPAKGTKLGVSMSMLRKGWRRTAQNCSSMPRTLTIQPHSGSQANMAVLFAALKPGDTILGDGFTPGHLTTEVPLVFPDAFSGSSPIE